ncbi:MAG: sodium:proton antiporter NhaD, partial [Bdellovibrionales bacterium]|nr:sodium:proton antiporter NhaD [Bdellovibrionales bacterium]
MNNKITLQTVWNSPFLRLFNITMLYILFVPSSAFAASAKFEPVPGLLWSPWSISALIIFIVCYALVPLENTLHIKKSKPVLLAAGLIWILAAMAYTARGHVDAIHAAVEHNILEYSELLLFLLAAMTFINSLEDRNVFQVLRAYLVSRGFTLRQIFWATGAVAFLLSPVADNLTTA